MNMQTNTFNAISPHLGPEGLSAKVIEAATGLVSFLHSAEGRRLRMSIPASREVVILSQGEGWNSAHIAYSGDQFETNVLWDDQVSSFGAEGQNRVPLGKVINLLACRELREPDEAARHIVACLRRSAACHSYPRIGCSDRRSRPCR